MSMNTVHSSIDNVICYSGSLGMVMHYMLHSLCIHRYTSCDKLHEKCTRTCTFMSCACSTVYRDQQLGKR